MLKVYQEWLILTHLLQKNVIEEGGIRHIFQQSLTFFARGQKNVLRRTNKILSAEEHKFRRFERCGKAGYSDSFFIQ